MAEIIKAIFLENEDDLHQVAERAIADLERMHPRHRAPSIIRAIVFLHAASHCSRPSCKMRAVNAIEVFRHPAAFAYSEVPGMPGIEFDDVPLET
jgi:hypothetical protein